jgi:hypothetical protein
MNTLPIVSVTTGDGAYYDWTITRRPERPWIHQYHQTFVDKVYLASKPNPLTGEPARVALTFEQALARIREVNNVTRGIPRISYLVGWQYDGHDSRYPDWGEVNARLKRPQDAGARASLLWLMREAAQYNTTVSLHINMLDAYEDAPSWQAYVEHDVIVKKEGALYRDPRAVWGGQQAYWIDYAREWETGLAQRRIDTLLAFLPIQQQGTIHIDAFQFPRDYPDPARLNAAMRRIFRYWRDRGVDVTCENQWDSRAAAGASDGFVGLQPMAWHLNPNFGGWKYTPENREVSEETWMQIPPSLVCGGVDWIDLQTGQLFGTSMHGEGTPDVADFVRPFCLQTLPWYFLNRFERLGLTRDGNTRTLQLSDGVVSRVADGQRTIHQHGRLIVDGTDVFAPALWRKTREIMAFSAIGYASRRWELPPEWHDVQAVDLYAITTNGLATQGTVSVEQGHVTLAMQAGQAISLVPADTPRHELDAIGISSRVLPETSAVQLATAI